MNVDTYSQAQELAEAHHIYPRTKCWHCGQHTNNWGFCVLPDSPSASYQCGACGRTTSLSLRTIQRQIQQGAEVSQ